MNFIESESAIAALIENELGGLPRLDPSATALRVCQQVNSKIELEGTITAKDGPFLLSLIERAQPRHILEIGVLAGGSSLLMLEYLREVGSEATLTSVDALNHCLFDPSKKLGFVVFDNLSPVPSAWTLIGGRGVANFHSALPPEQQAWRYDFAFIDAHHGHPWAALDTLCLLPFATPGSWVALHDVALTFIVEKYACRGPQFLLQKWPLEALLADGPIPNIGAIRLSDAAEGDAERLMQVLEIPWEYGIDPYWVKTISKHLETCLSPAQMERIGVLFELYKDLPLAPK